MQFKLGTVVSLKSNGLLPLADYQFLSLGGNENFTTPLMVVTEILFNTQIEINEETGEEAIREKGRNKYRCMYFSNKSMKFEENWFVENELTIYGNRKIGETVDLEGQNDFTSNQIHSIVSSDKIKWGSIVRFKTVDAEASKTKSFSVELNKKNKKPLLTFTSPELLVVGFSSVDKKESLIDPYNGLKKREKPTKLVKCKFFNKELDKFSEQYIPIECLQILDNSRLEENLQKIKTIIANKVLSLIKTVNESYFGRPQSVQVISGRYQLILWNELLKKNELIWFDKINTIQEIDPNESSKYYPGIHEVDGQYLLVEIKQMIEVNPDTINRKNYKIVYRNLKEEIVSRYIHVRRLSKPNNDENHPEKVHYFLKSHCYLREAERDFRSDRILSIRTINNELLNDFLNSTIQ